MDELFHAQQLNRRAMLQRCGMGIGSLGLTSLLQQEGLAATPNPLAARQPDFKTKAKSVIWLFINGIDLDHASKKKVISIFFSSL